MAHIPSQFPDLLETTAKFTDIFNETYKRESSDIEEFYRVVRNPTVNVRFSSVSGMGQLMEFTGLVDYGTIAQGYDVTVTPVQFARGFSAERTLMDDDQFSILNGKPKALGTAAATTRNYHKFRVFDNSFSVDSLFGVHTEGVSLCSNSHTTTTGASTAVGFDNLTTAALSSVAISAMRVQMLNFRDEQGERIDGNSPNVLLVPQQGSMEETAWEIINSMGKWDEVTNTANFNRDRYTVKAKLQLSDANNYWLISDSGMKGDQGLVWHERNAPEFANIEDFDSLIMKWRAWGRWANHWIGWRWVIGAQVA